MADIYKCFFELIAVSLGKQTKLSSELSEVQWEYLFKLSQQHAIAGVCFVGVQHLKKNGQMSFPNIYTQWLAQAAIIQQRNKQLDFWSKEIYEEFNQSGFKSCILKGQAVVSLYTDELKQLRQSGDIDLWVTASPQDIIKWGKEHGIITFFDYHHADYFGKRDIEIEFHYRPTISRNLIRNFKLQYWFNKEKSNLFEYKTDLGFNIPSPEFNVILILNHNFWHLLFEGIGMRQMIDLYFAILKLDENQFTVVQELIYRFNLEKFTCACMWILCNIFKMDDKKALCKPNELEGHFLLEEILKAGNFGHYDSRLSRDSSQSNLIKALYSMIRHSMRLIKHYPAEVAWTPLGIAYISAWGRLHRMNFKFI